MPLVQDLADKSWVCYMIKTGHVPKPPVEPFFKKIRPGGDVQGRGTP